MPPFPRTRLSGGEEARGYATARRAAVTNGSRTRRFGEPLHGQRLPLP